MKCIDSTWFLWSQSDKWITDNFQGQLAGFDDQITSQDPFTNPIRVICHFPTFVEQTCGSMGMKKCHSLLKVDDDLFTWSASRRFRVKYGFATHDGR